MTLYQVLANGRKNIVAPQLLLILAGGLIWTLGMSLGLEFWVMAISFPLIFIPAVIHRLLKITDWKIWALENLEGAKNFKEKAENEWILIPFIDKYATVSSRQKFILGELDHLYNLEEPPNPKYLNTNEVPVFYNKNYNLFQVICWIAGSVFSGLFIIIWIQETGYDSYLLFFLLIFFICLSQVYTNYRQLKTSKAPLIISNEGISIKNRLHPWAEISNYSISTNLSDSHGTNHRLKIELKYNRLKMLNYGIGIDDLDIERTELEEILTHFSPKK